MVLMVNLPSLSLSTACVRAASLTCIATVQTVMMALLQGIYETVLIINTDKKKDTMRTLTLVLRVDASIEGVGTSLLIQRYKNITSQETHQTVYCQLRVV